MRPATLPCLLVLMLLLGCAPQERFPIQQVATATGVSLEDGFAFTISPDGRWLLYAQRPDDGAQGYIDGITLALVDMRTGERTLSHAPEGISGAQVSLALAEDCWTPDSGACRIPARRDVAQDYPQRVLPLLAIDVRGEELRFVWHAQDAGIGEGAAGAIRYADLAREFTCADCVVPEPYDDGVELRHALLEQAIGVDEARRVRAEEERLDPISALAPGAQRIYLVEGSHTGHARILAYPAYGGEGEELASFAKRTTCVGIDMPRPSPDDRWLAFMRADGCTFIDAPALFVLDLRTKDVFVVAQNAYGAPMWSPDSSRLYFYRCAQGGACTAQDGIAFAQMG